MELIPSASAAVLLHATIEKLVYKDGLEYTITRGQLGHQNQVYNPCQVPEEEDGWSTINGPSLCC